MITWILVILVLILAVFYLVWPGGALTGFGWDWDYGTPWVWIKVHPIEAIIVAVFVFLLVAVIVTASVLKNVITAAPVAQAPATATLALTATSVSVPTDTAVPPTATAVPATAVPAATATPAPAATATTAPAAPADSTSCVLDTFAPDKQFGVQLTVNKKPDTLWEFDPKTASRVAGDSTHPELVKDASLAGCPVVIEGRKTLVQEHHIWILEPGSTMYLDPDGIFRAKEFSAWAYPSNWNLGDFSTQKPPIAAEFVDAKRNNMQANNYDWPIFVHLSNGNTMEFKPGQKTGAVLPNNCNITDPSRINVTGVYDPGNKSFDASIGAEGCTTAAKC
jgi:hypothetical protein